MYSSFLTFCSRNTHHTITVITVINDTRYTDTYYRRMRASSTGVITAQLRRGTCCRCSIAAPPLPYDHCAIPGPSTAITVNDPSLHTAIAYCSWHTDHQRPITMPALHHTSSRSSHAPPTHCAITEYDMICNHLPPAAALEWS